jgi:hypothetical protein
MTGSQAHVAPDEELRQLAHEYQRVRQAHSENTAPSVRRQLEGKLEDLQRRFERTLEQLVPEDEARATWRAVLYHQAEPPEPAASSPPPIFRGRSDIGAEVEVREGNAGGYDVLVDGSLVLRLPDPVDQGHLRVDNLDFREVFDATPEALDALLVYTRDPDGDPPWPFAAELLADGLVDRTFGLTPRGRRALATLEPV